MVDRGISQKMRDPFTVAQTLRLLPSQRIPFSNRTADIERPHLSRVTHEVASAQITPWPRFCKPRGLQRSQIVVRCDRNASQEWKTQTARPILATCQPCGFVFPTSRYRAPFRAKTHQRASLSHGTGPGADGLGQCAL